MTPLLLSVTGVLFLTGVGLQIWFSDPRRPGRQAAMQLPSVLLYAVGVSLLMFTLFPDSYADGRTLGFSIGGAAAFILVFSAIAFQWLARTGGRDELAAEVHQAKKQIEQLKLRLGIVETGRKPQRLQRTVKTLATIRHDRRHRLGFITGNIANVTGVDVWVNAGSTANSSAEPRSWAPRRRSGGCSCSPAPGRSSACTRRSSAVSYRSSARGTGSACSAA